MYFFFNYYKSSISKSIFIFTSDQHKHTYIVTSKQTNIYRITKYKQ